MNVESIGFLIWKKYGMKEPDHKAEECMVWGIYCM